MKNVADVNLYAIHYIMAPVGAWRVILPLEGALSSRDQPSSILDRGAPAE